MAARVYGAVISLLFVLLGAYQLTHSGKIQERTVRAMKRRMGIWRILPASLFEPAIMSRSYRRMGELGGLLALVIGGLGLVLVILFWVVR
jgi:hypothetical protein